MGYFLGRITYDATRAVGETLASNLFESIMACVTVCVVLYFFWWLVLPIIVVITLVWYLASLQRSDSQEKQPVTTKDPRGYTTRIEGLL